MKHGYTVLERLGFCLGAWNDRRWKGTHRPPLWGFLNRQAIKIVWWGGFLYYWRRRITWRAYGAGKVSTMSARSLWDKASAASQRRYVRTIQRKK